MTLITLLMNQLTLYNRKLVYNRKSTRPFCTGCTYLNLKYLKVFWTRLRKQPTGTIARIVTIANMRQRASMIRTNAEPEFSLRIIKFCRSDNHHTTKLQNCTFKVTEWSLLFTYLTRFRVKNRWKLTKKHGKWNKIKSAENIVLSKNGKLIKDEEEVVNIFDEFFLNIAPNLGVRAQHDFLNTTDSSRDPIENAICKYENHPSIVSIKKHMEWKRQILLLFLKLSQKRKLKI